MIPSRFRLPLTCPQTTPSLIFSLNLWPGHFHSEEGSIFVSFTKSFCEEGYHYTGIWPCPFSGVDGLVHYIMEYLILVRTDILTVLLNLVEVLWCGCGLDPTPSWLCLI